VNVLPSRRAALLGVAATVGTATLITTGGPAGAVSPDVVISQVYGGGGNTGATYTNDYIQLYNGGAADANLSGWSVQYASAAGSTWRVTSLTGTVAPGARYLTQEATGASGTTPLPYPDATGSIAM
jgi:predicted extracellular nuclease